MIEAYFRGASYGMHRHDTYAIGMTTFGVQSMHYRGQLVHSKPGETVVICPDEAHDGWSGTAGGYTYRIIHIRPDMLQTVLGGGALPLLGEGVSRNSVLHAAVRALLHRPGDAQDVLTFEDQLLDLALALQQAAGNERRHSVDPRAASVARDFIDSQPHLRIDLDVLARASGRDRWSLSRDFRQFFGTSPSRYMTMRRLDVARTLMAKGLPLVQCATDAGFADQSHMTRQFASAFGLTPKRWLTLQRPLAQAARQVS